MGAAAEYRRMVLRRRLEARRHSLTPQACGIRAFGYGHSCQYLVYTCGKAAWLLSASVGSQMIAAHMSYKCRCSIELKIVMQ